MALQQVNTIVVAVTVGGQWVRALGGNLRRTNIIFSPDSGVSAVFSVRDEGTGGLGMLSLSSDITRNMMYRDWGALITGEVYLNTSFGNGNITVTEIYTVRIPSK